MIEMARPCVVKVCVFIIITLMAAVAFGTILLLIRNTTPPTPPPRYYATVTTTDLGRLSSFVVSLGVAASPGRDLTGGGYCLDRGTVVEVSYRDVALARAVLESWEAVCALWWMPPGKAWWTRVVATGNNFSTLPAFVADGLAADERRGARVLDVSIWTADGKTAWCGARRLGDDDKKAAAACDLRNSTSSEH